MKSKGKGKYEVTVKIKNTGKIAGAEAVQVYVKDKKPTLLRPEKELKAFVKTFLNPGEQKSITLMLDKSSFEYYDGVKNTWMTSKGGYQILVGTSSANVPLKSDIKY